MKSYTDLSQSKKLAEFLPIESADMFLAINGTLPVMSKYIDDGLVTADNTAIPCWSLAALLDILPSGKALIHDKGNQEYKCICNNIDTYFYDNPVDACYEMIIKLHEQKIL